MPHFLAFLIILSAFAYRPAAGMKSNHPVCFSEAHTWLDNMMDTIYDVTSAYECQELCQAHAQDHFDAPCGNFTWFNSSASVLNANKCELFHQTDPAHRVECEHCLSGPLICTCSTDTECSLHNNVLIDIVQFVTFEAACQNLCRVNFYCHYYMWFGRNGSPFQDACALLISCEDTDASFEGFASGPESCEYYPNEVTSPNYPNNYTYGNSISWEAAATSFDETIEILFVDFDTEPSFDYVSLTYFNGTEFFRHSGHALPNPPVVRSFTDFVTIYFHSDGSNNYKGFFLKWRVLCD